MASLWDGVELQRDKLNVHAIAYTLAADSKGTILPFYAEWSGIENTISEHESITEDDAVSLAIRIKDLHLRYSFDGRVHYIALLAGQCLKLKDGQAAGEVFTAMVMLKANKRHGATLKRIINLAVPAELNAAFGVESFSWLQSRSEDFARDYARKGCKPGSPASRWFDGGDIGFLTDRECLSQPEPGSIPVVLAPDEATIAEFIKRAASSPDYWDALVKAAAMLLRCRQPLGDALTDWLIEAAGRDRGTKLPKGSKDAKLLKNVLRKHAIIEAVRALERCGMWATRNEASRSYSACDAVAEAFEMQPVSVMDIWKVYRKSCP